MKAAIFARGRVAHANPIGAPSKLRLGWGFDSGVVLNPGAPVRCPQLETGADLPNYKVDELGYPTQAQLEWGTLVNLFGESFGNLLRESSGSMFIGHRLHPRHEATFSRCLGD
jgi:hypothetical protein